MTISTLKKYISLMFLMFLLSSCGMNSSTITNGAYSNVMLSVSAVSVYQNYENVKTIINNNKTLFTDEELKRLNTIQNNFNGVTYSLKNITNSTNNIDKLLLDIGQFDYIYLVLKTNYIDAKTIIDPKLKYMSIDDNLTLLQFDRSASLLDSQVSDIKIKINENIGKSNIDVTKILTELLVFAGAMAKILAVM